MVDKGAIARRLHYETGKSQTIVTSNQDGFDRTRRSSGYALVRARYNNGEIRLEVKREEMVLTFEKREGIAKVAHDIGFKTIALDLYGYGG